MCVGWLRLHQQHYYFDGSLGCDLLHLAGGFIPVHTLSSINGFVFVCCVSSLLQTCHLCQYGLLVREDRRVPTCMVFCSVRLNVFHATHFVYFVTWNRNKTPLRNARLKEEPLKFILENRSRSFMLLTLQLLSSSRISYCTCWAIICITWFQHFEWNYTKISFGTKVHVL